MVLATLMSSGALYYFLMFCSTSTWSHYLYVQGVTRVTCVFPAECKQVARIQMPNTCYTIGYITKKINYKAGEQYIVVLLNAAYH